MKILSAILKRYNANTRDSHVGDCVKRSLSVAFRMDYDEVSRELNRIKREVGASAYNVSRVFNVFLQRHGDYKWTTIPAGNRPTVEEFADDYSSGTYLLLTGRAKDIMIRGLTDHMVCVVDGTIYDSWDSRQDHVVDYIRVTDNYSVENVDTLDDWIDEICRDLADYIDKLSNQCKPYLELSSGFTANERIDKYTYEVYVRAKVLQGTENQRDWETPYYYTNEYLGHKLVVKWNPRMNSKDNINNIIKKTKQKIYDWAYMIRKDLKDHHESKSIQFHPEFRGSKSKLMTFPEWVRPLITYYRDDGNPEYTDKYKMYIDALPDDPRAGSDPEVMLVGDTLRELKSCLEDYRENYARFGYDY